MRSFKVDFRLCLSSAGIASTKGEFGLKGWLKQNSNRLTFETGSSFALPVTARSLTSTPVVLGSIPQRATEKGKRRAALVGRTSGSLGTPSIVVWGLLKTFCRGAALAQFGPASVILWHAVQACSHILTDKTTCEPSRRRRGPCGTWHAILIDVSMRLAASLNTREQWRIKYRTLLNGSRAS